MHFLVTTAVTAAAVVVTFALLYIFLICGRRRHPDLPEFYGRLYAHRGLFSNGTPDAPENSMAAFRLAARHGYGIELDVHISADGELFVFHDDNMRRMCALDRKITSLSSSEIEKNRLLGGEQHIPRFSEVLSLVGGQVPLIIELKCEAADPPDPLCRAVTEMLSGYDGAYCIESFNPYVVRWFRKNAPGVFRGQLSEMFLTKKSSSGSTAVRFAMQNLWLNAICRPDFVAYNCLHRHALAFRLWRHVLGMPAACWTVRDVETLEELRLRRDCDAIIFEGFSPEVKK